MPPRNLFPEGENVDILLRVANRIDSISVFVGRVTFFFVFILMLVMVYEVFARYIFNSPTIWAMELSGYLMTMFVALGGAYVLKKNAHVNVDIFHSRLTDRGKAILDVITFPLFALFLYFFFVLSGKQALTSVKYMQTSGTIWDIPIWPLKILLAAGVGLVLLQGIGKFIRDLVKAITGSAPTT
jgi:TRAP-type mannitol/chloroaromatic compound transport system permease small subunit